MFALGDAVGRYIERIIVAYCSVTSLMEIGFVFFIDLANQRTNLAANVLVYNLKVSCEGSIPRAYGLLSEVAFYEGLT